MKHRIALYVLPGLLWAAASSSGCSGGADAADDEGTGAGAGGSSAAADAGHSGGAVNAGTGGASVATGGRSGTGGAPGAGGGTGTGGKTGSGGATDGGGGTPHVVEACPGLDGGTVGVWESITPPGTGYPKWCTPQWNATCPGPGEKAADGTLATYGTNAVAIDPNNTATVYLGTSSLGFFKSTDCGATWAHITTGTNGTEIDKGRNWSLVVDPIDSQVIYTTAGYAAGDVWKSTNGGVDWTAMLSPTAKAALAAGFVEKIAMDPTNHLHLTVSAHGGCTNGMNNGCLAETKDGGQTWTLTNSGQSWSEGDGQTMIDANTWFYGALFGGIWRTSNAGSSWTQVYKGNAAGDVYHASDGSLYAGGTGNVLHSADGISWTAVPNSKACGGNSNGGRMLTGDGTTMFVSDGRGLGWNQTQPPAGGWYYSTSETSPTTWTSLNSPATMMSGGISIAYDKDHHILYSSNYVSGFWRLVVP
jgi:hypothetical protein